VNGLLRRERPCEARVHAYGSVTALIQSAVTLRATCEPAGRRMRGPIGPTSRLRSEIDLDFIFSDVR